MKANKPWRRALHLLLVLAIMLPFSIWGQGHAGATGTDWRDITSNAQSGVRSVVAANGSIYLLNGMTKQILVRGASDTSWAKLADLPANDFTSPYKLAIRDGIMYIVDQGNVNAQPTAIPSKVMKSIDNGQNWTEIPAPADNYQLNLRYSLHSLFFDPSGNLYVAGYGSIYKLGTNDAWSPIPPITTDSDNTYGFTSATIDGSGNLYSVMMKFPKYGAGYTADLYSYSDTSWSKVNVSSPINSLALNSDSSGHIFLAQQVYDPFQTPSPHIYLLDGTLLSRTETTNNFSWTSGGVAYDNGYYYIADMSGTIRTTSPTFGKAKTPPALTADTTDNDTAHAIELTFADDANWRAAISDVTLTKGGTTTNAVYSLHAGGVTLTGVASPGTYTIKVIAKGYQDATVTQEINLAPSVWYDITGNLALAAPGLSANEAVYAFQPANFTLFYRNPSDIQWQSEPRLQGQFERVDSFVSRGNKWYVADLTSTAPTNQMSVANVRISSDRGVTWSTYSLPLIGVIDLPLNPLTVSPTGAVYLNDGKNVSKLSENGTWSQIPVLADDGGYSFVYTGVAVNASGTLYANIRKYNQIDQYDNSAKLYKYNESGEQWDFVADSPSAMMQLYTDTASGMHAATTTAMNGESPRAHIYTIDDNGFTDAATLESLDQAHYGLAYGDGYYYTVGIDSKIHTTNPNFATGLQPPALTPDTTDNDDAHPLELTFADNADWRAHVTNVTFKKAGTVVSAAYRLTQGVLQISQALPAGTYTIEIAATGYRTATVEQTVRITAPALVADTTDNDTNHAIVITFADNAQWRESVTSVVYNGITAGHGMYELTAGKLTFPAGKLPIGNVAIVVKASDYPDATVTQVVSEPVTQTPNEPITGSGTSQPTSGTGSNQPSTTNKEVIKIDVLGGSRNGNVVSQAEIVRTTDDKGRKSDQVSFTAELAAQAVESLKSSEVKQAVIVVPDAKDEVSDVHVSLPREAMQKLTEAGIGLTIETRGATIQIPASSLAASNGDLYFHVVPIKDAAERQEAVERAKANSNSADIFGEATAIGRPMTIETNLQSQPVTLTLPLGSYPSEQISRLRVYIEHSDGTKEWLKGEPATDDAGGAAIRFTVTKFSTFTVIDAGAPDPEQAKPYMFGYEDGTFRPEQSVTRGQLAAILARLYGEQSGNTAVQGHAYKDEEQFQAWAAGAIGQVSALGFMNGYEDGTFQADRDITRAEAATIIARLAKLSDTGSAADFKDTRGHWADASIGAAVQAGLLKGYEDGSFAPERNLSRAEAVTIINRLIGRTAVVGQTPLWPDVPTTHWAFGDIQAASSSGAH